MARMRTLKPGFFTDDQLAEVPALGRILFAGLWCLSDREGRLEDRPRRIKAEVLPFDSCNVDHLLTLLAERGFILRYEIDGHRFIQVTNFTKHQKPHSREPASTYPGPAEALPKPGPGTTLSVPSRASHARVPDHGIQEQSWEQSLEQVLETTPDGAEDSAEPSPGDDRVDAIYQHFKDRVQPKSRLCPRKKIAARLKRFSADELREGIDHFAEDWWWMEHNANQGAAWFFESDGRSEQFLLLKPRSAENVVQMNGAPHKPVGAPPDVPADSPFRKYAG